MKKLISTGIAFALTMSFAPAIALANDTSIGQPPKATFQTLSNLSNGDGTNPTAMTGQQLAAVEGMAHLGSLAQEILASTQALVNQQMQNLPQGEELAQEIIASTQALVNQGLSQYQVPNGSYRSHKNGLPRVSKGGKGMSHKVPRASGKGSHSRTNGKGMMHTVKTPKVKLGHGVHRGFKGMSSKRIHGTNGKGMVHTIKTPRVKMDHIVKAPRVKMGYGGYRGFKGMSNKRIPAMKLR